MRQGLQAFASALTIEALLLAGAGLWLTARTPAPPLEVVPLSIESAAPQPEPAPRNSEPAPAMQAAPAPVPPRVRSAVPPAATAPAPAPAPAEAAPAVAAPSVFSAPPPPAPAPATPSPATPDPRPEYNARVKAAVQAAVVVPPAAAALNFRGRARIEFKLRDGQPSQAQVIVTSGMGLVDRAALQSVQSASYPAPPTLLQGRDETYQVWVEFNP